jgi:hypothetical protein
MPAVNFTLEPRGRKAAPHKAQHRHTSPLAQELAQAARDRKSKRKDFKLREEFEEAARDDGKGKAGGESSQGPRPARDPDPDRPRRPRRRPGLDPGRER